MDHLVSEILAYYHEERPHQSKGNEAGAIGLTMAGKPNERMASQIVEQLGVSYEIEPRFGLVRLGVIVKVQLCECSPTAPDLGEFGFLRHLRVLDLSGTPVGDAELSQLVGSPCHFIIVPDGQTSEELRNRSAKGQVTLWIGVSPTRSGSWK